VFDIVSHTAYKQRSNGILIWTDSKIVQIDHNDIRLGALCQNANILAPKSFCGIDRCSIKEISRRGFRIRLFVRKQICHRAILTISGKEKSPFTDPVNVPGQSHILNHIHRLCIGPDCHIDSMGLIFCIGKQYGSVIGLCNRCVYNRHFIFR
jgi:hypothetical protein